MVNTCSADQHVAILAFPFASHASLFLGLARRLAVAAPTVTFSFFSTAKSNVSLFSVPSLDNTRSCNISDGIPEGYVFFGKPQEHIELFLKVAPEELGICLRVAKRLVGWEDEILRFISGFRALRLGNLPAGVLFGNLGSSFSTMLHKMGQTPSKN
ncbi:hypothetical protein RJ639_009589 [Escallonia herrerae]|uniref:Uncharacterized protein n=1 Tax=Escallonia herrerae TaxID=1293975 RepID=A0AA88VSH7_9ASTE|nr:hypothetical protein RJ639_009589 [Escallonia herrerae]